MITALLLSLSFGGEPEPEVLAQYAKTIVQSDMEGLPAPPQPLGQDVGIMPPTVFHPPLILGPLHVGAFHVYSWRDKRGTSYVVVTDGFGNTLVGIHQQGWSDFIWPLTSNQSRGGSE